MAPFGCTVCRGRGCYRKIWRCGALYPWYSMGRATDCNYLQLSGQVVQCSRHQCSFCMCAQVPWKSGTNCWGWSPGFCIPHKFPIARPGGKGEKHVYIRDWGMNKVLGTHGKAIRSLAGEIWKIPECRHLSSVGKEKNQRGFGKERRCWALYDLWLLIHTVSREIMAYH